MTKDKSRHETSFFNFKMPEVVFWSVRPDCPSLDTVLADLVELSEEGCKVSFGAKKGTNGFSVSVTLPVVGNLDASVCASFWAGDALEAFQTAYIVTFVFDGRHNGWEKAQSAVDTYRDRMEREVREFIAQKKK